MIFTNSSFANNRDLFSQIDYVICLADEIYANILHWSSIKCKRMTRNFLTIELFAMIHDFDVESILKSILIKLLDKKISMSLILIFDSKSLYDCLIHLSITIEKRSMIDVMILCQFYERSEITKMIWIHDINNSTNSMIKIKSSTALKTIIDINQINLNIIEWVKRATIKETVNQSKKTRQRNEWDEKFQKDKSIFQRGSSVSIKIQRYDSTSRVARHGTTSRVASLITWFTFNEHYI
jgi:hypothetical protein